jgi:hypothetical protein
MHAAVARLGTRSLAGVSMCRRLALSSSNRLWSLCPFGQCTVLPTRLAFTSSNRLWYLCPFGQCTALPTRLYILLLRQIGCGLSAHLASALYCPLGFHGLLLLHEIEAAMVVVNPISLMCLPVVVGCSKLGN